MKNITTQNLGASGAVPERPSSPPRTAAPDTGNLDSSTPDASISVSKLHAKGFAYKIVVAARRDDWADYVNLCEQAAHIGRIAMLESRADEAGIVAP
jgi:hypothetical protein